MKNLDIQVEIYSAKPISFQINEKNKHKFNPDKTSLILSPEFQIDEIKSVVALKIDLEVLSKTNDENFFSLTSLFEFGVFNLNDALISEEKELILKHSFARRLINIAIGGTRGMLSVYLSSTKYENFTLPIANIPDDFFE